MSPLPIRHRNGTLEIVAKLMNSIAAKYNCSVKYNPEGNSLKFLGEDCHKLAIVHEFIAYYEAV